MVLAVKGYKLTLTIPESMTVERRKILKTFGTKIVLTPKEKGMNGAEERAEAIAKD